MDLAVLCTTINNKVVFVHGNGDGSFDISHRVSVVGSTPRSIAAGDSDLDGYPDVAVVDEGSKTVSVLHGGPGGPTAVTQVLNTNAAEPAPMSAIFVDWNLDGYADLAIVKLGAIMFFKSDKTGGFTFESWQMVGSYSRYLVAADLDGDFRPDFINGCTNGSGMGCLHIILTPPQAV